MLLKIMIRGLVRLCNGRVMVTCWCCMGIAILSVHAILSDVVEEIVAASAAQPALAPAAQPAPVAAPVAQSPAPIAAPVAPPAPIAAPVAAPPAPIAAAQPASVAPASQTVEVKPDGSISVTVNVNINRGPSVPAAAPAASAISTAAGAAPAPAAKLLGLPLPLLLPPLTTAKPNATFTANATSAKANATSAKATASSSVLSLLSRSANAKHASPASQKTGTARRQIRDGRAAQVFLEEQADPPGWRRVLHDFLSGTAEHQSAGRSHISLPGETGGNFVNDAQGEERSERPDSEKREDSGV